MLNYTLSKLNRKIYKLNILSTISNHLIVSMIPGDRKVAGCFNPNKNLEVFYNGRCFGFC